MRPDWTAEETVQYYRDHRKGIQAGASLLIVSGMFFLPLTAGIFSQMRRIPNLHSAVPALQLGSGAAAIFAFMMPGVILASANFRLDRPVEITQALNELFWLTVMMPWQPLMMQSFALAYAVIADTRPKPLYPKPMAIVNIVAPIVYIPPLTVHCFTTGLLAWNSVFSFWVPSIACVIQLLVDSVYLAKAANEETEAIEKEC